MKMKYSLFIKSIKESKCSMEISKFNHYVLEKIYLEVFSDNPPCLVLICILSNTVPHFKGTNVYPFYLESD